MKKILSTNSFGNRILAVCLAVCIVALCAGCGETNENSAAADVPAAEIVQAEEPMPDYVGLVKEQMETGQYYEAVLTIIECQDTAPESDEAAECDEIFLQIEEKLKAAEPENGTVIERTFKYNGGGELKANAASGSAEITVLNTENTEEVVRFYVREGEVASVNLPAGIYAVSYKVGTLWFGDDIGFGDFCYSGQFDEELEFEYSEDNAWISNSVWEITV